MASIHRQLIVNHVPKEETRIALLEDGKLEEIYTERESSDFHVGNIYLGKVTNVESAIQAAFIDFGVGRNGFLHVSDLHPKFFPGENDETTESVGQKTPHRQRPPIQKCLKRGQEILVQVLKEGIGTKGPTLTTYLSIPGRFLVMMPHMQQMGVSRKVEDLDQRREMRRILDSLDLPEDFGFIIRTAGMHAGKTELKRDLAYLQRLWKSIDKQRRDAKGPTRLYVESDLLTRTVRDLASLDLDEIVIDDKSAVNQLDRFMRLVAPRRKGPKIHAYVDQMPIFHRYRIEPQMRGIHAREVPLPGGGSIVIDSAEAMVVIDVNSGKMRQFRNAEATAFQTNLEAIDEVCRQLRLRDLGGIVVIDTIDMISGDRRKQLESRLRENLKRDRARTEFLRISNFGLIQMTRQRVRAPLRKSQYSTCTICEGRGVIQVPEATAVDALRDLTYWAAHPKVATIEMVVSSPLAAVLVSRKRKQIAEIERATDKHVEIRVGPDFAADRVDFYAYDEKRADLELASLESSFPAQLEATSLAPPDASDEESDIDLDIDEEDDSDESDQPQARSRSRSRRRSRRKSTDSDQDGPDKPEDKDQTKAGDQSASIDESAPTKKKRRRRSRKKKSTTEQQTATHDAQPGPEEPASEESSSPSETDDAAAKKKRSRRRRKKTTTQASDTASESATGKPEQTDDTSDQPEDDDAKSKAPRRRRRRSRSRASQSTTDAPAIAVPDDQPTKASTNGTTEHIEDQSAEPKRKSRRRRRGKKTAASTTETKQSAPKQETASKPSDQEPAKSEPKSDTPSKPRRTLYVNRRKITPAELAVASKNARDES